MRVAPYGGVLRNQCQHEETSVIKLISILLLPVKPFELTNKKNVYLFKLQVHV